MRKLVSLGLLALSVGLLSTPSFAGNAPQCEFLKDGHTKGLYGLCTAYANANTEFARLRIWDNYEALRQQEEPTLEDIFNPVVASEPETFCPCWNTDQLADAGIYGVPDSCNFSGTEAGADFTVYDDQNGVDNYFQFRVTDTYCMRVDPFSDGAIVLISSAEVEALCRDGIEALVNEDFGGSCL